MKTSALCAVLSIAAALCPLASAHPPGQDAALRTKAKTNPSAAHSPPSPAQQYFTDAPLVDQYGKTQRLYTDLLKNKVVVLSSFFTHCDSSCPIVAGKFAALQTRLGARLGRQVHLLLLTTDPLRDTPDVLRGYADKFNAKPGWYFLTGDKTKVDQALHRFGHYAPTPEAHSNLIIIGNEATGLWQKAVAILTERDLLQLVENALADIDS